MSDAVHEVANGLAQTNGHVEPAAPALANGHAEGQAEGHGVAQLEAGVAGLNVQPDLHRACAAGSIDDVRAALGRGEDLEAMDMSTGCTPIVLAIQAGHGDVVRELLFAGAIPPPPSVTSDPVMLALLYPPPFHGMAPPFGVPPPFFPGQPFFDRGGPVPAGPNTLPPPEIAKTIPCRNGPNCKYGANCHFLHLPAGARLPVPGGPAPFYPPFAPADGFAPGPAPFQPGAPFYPPHEFIPEQAEPVVADGTGVAPVPSAPVFVPGAGAPLDPSFVPPPQAMSPSQFGMTPLSPSMPPSSPPAGFAGFASSPPTAFAAFGQAPLPPPNGAPYPRRQSFGQFNKPFGHGKKASFSGPKPWGAGRPPAGHLGTWKDGVPPPCAFFREGKCRNGEFCKFPHMDDKGNDHRNPDVIRGVIPPVSARPPRPLRMPGLGHFDPSIRQQQFAKSAAAAPVLTEAPSEAAEAALPASAPLAAPPAVPVPVTTVPPTAALPAKPVAPAVVAPVPNMGRSMSQPGLSRVPPATSAAAARTHSPAMSNGSFTGAHAHPATRRAGSAGRYANGSAAPAAGALASANVSRSSSAGPGGRVAPAQAAQRAQRVPGADEFPALATPAGGSASGTPTAERREPSWGSKTAAQVLSEPAPARAPSKTEDDAAAVAVDGQGLTMDSDSEADAVIISKAPSPAPAPVAPVTPAAPASAPASTPVPAAAEPAPAAPAQAPVADVKAKRASVSFASIAGLASVDPAPVALKA